MAIQNIFLLENFQHRCLSHLKMSFLDAFWHVHCNCVTLKIKAKFPMIWFQVLFPRIRMIIFPIEIIHFYSISIHNCNKCKCILYWGHVTLLRHDSKSLKHIYRCISISRIRYVNEEPLLKKVINIERFLNI